MGSTSENDYPESDTATWSGFAGGGSGPLEIGLDFRDRDGAAIRKRVPQHFAEEQPRRTAAGLERQRGQVRQRSAQDAPLRKRRAFHQDERRRLRLAAPDQLGADRLSEPRAHVDDRRVGCEHARRPIVLALALTRAGRDEGDMAGKAAARERYAELG